MSLYQISFDSIINANEESMVDFVRNEFNKGTCTVFNLMSQESCNYLNEASRQDQGSGIEVIVEKLLSALDQDRSLYISITRVKQNELLLEDFNPNIDNKQQFEYSKLKSKFEKERNSNSSERMTNEDEFDNNTIPLRGGRTAYIVDSLESFQKMIKAVKSLRRRETFIFQFYSIITKLRTRNKRYLPSFTIVDLLITEQNDLLEEICEHIHRIQVFNMNYQTYGKNRIINELMSRHILTSTNMFLWVQINIQGISRSITELLSFMGIFKRTSISVNIKDFDPMNIPVKELNKKILIRPKQLTPIVDSLPIIVEKKKSKTKSHSNARTAELMLRDNKYNIGQEYFNNKQYRNFRFNHSDFKRRVKLKNATKNITIKFKLNKTSLPVNNYEETKKEVTLKPSILKTKPAQEITVDYKIKNVYGAFSVRNILDNLKSCEKSESNNQYQKDSANRSLVPKMEYNDKPVLHQKIKQKLKMKSTYKIDDENFIKYANAPKGMESLQEII